MRLRNAVALVIGLVVFAAGVIAGVLALGLRQYPAYRFLLAITAPILMLTGFELLHFAFSLREKEYQLLSRGLRGLLLDLLQISLAVGLTLATINYQHPSKLFCGGDLGAGFPAAFLCDALGESPISNWGKISWTDIPNVLGGYLDILFFAAILSAISLVARRTIQWRTRKG
jgi:hypothetical protein